MAIFRGFVASLHVRSDGVAEVVLEAVHAGNATQTFFIRNLDGDLTQTNKRLAQTGLLRDALVRVLPVQIDYTSTAEQGDLIDDVTTFPRPSIEGRTSTSQLSGVVVGVGITELGPLSGTSPYRDAADLAAVMLLTDAGAIEMCLLDLQRPDPTTAQAELRLLNQAHRSRRPVILQISSYTAAPRNPNVRTDGGGAAQAFIVSTQWIPTPVAELDLCYAFVERLTQRYESYDAQSAPQLSHLGVVYTTAPGQTPEGDISDNGSFTPQRLVALVHDDSPLVSRLEAALRDGLQVKLGLSAGQIHAVDLISPLGSAARPLWIAEETRFVAREEDAGSCSNVPSIQGPDGATIGKIPRTLVWRAKGLFQEGVWRFVLAKSANQASLKIDGQPICCHATEQQSTPQHMYLKGMHAVELELDGVTCSSEISLSVYRIR